MVNSLFVLNLTGDVIIEKHWRGLINRSICEVFWLAAAKSTSFNEVPPIIPAAGARYHLIHLKSGELFYLAVVERDESPLLVLEFLTRVDDVFKDYFKTVSEAALKDNFVSVYQLLEEMMDNGMPFNTEPNQLRAMIPVPGSLPPVLTLDAKPDTTQVPEGTLTAIPWRRVGVKYAANEIYFDIIEDIDAIIDVNGSVLSSEINGKIMSTCKLSGMPDLNLVFRNPRIIDDASFHPCVRYARWEQSKIISFVPPDGAFKLMEYRVRSQITFPIYVRPSVSFMDGVGKISIVVSSKAPSDVTVEDLRLSIPWDKCVASCVLSSPNGKVDYNDRTKLAVWEIGKLPGGKTYTLSGTVHLAGGIKVTNPAVEVGFKVNMFCSSGLKVESLAVHNVSYKPYKGVRSLTKAGRFQYRT